MTRRRQSGDDAVAEGTPSLVVRDEDLEAVAEIIADALIDALLVLEESAPRSPRRE